MFNAHRLLCHSTLGSRVIKKGRGKNFRLDYMCRQNPEFIVLSGLKHFTSTLISNCGNHNQTSRFQSNRGKQQPFLIAIIIATIPGQAPKESRSQIQFESQVLRFSHDSNCVQVND